MSVITHLLDFRLPSGHNLFIEEIENIVLDGFEKHLNFPNEPNFFQRLFTDKKSMSLLKGPEDSTVTIRHYARERSLVTVTIEYFLDDGHDPLLTYNDCKILEKLWGSRGNQCKTVKTLPRVLRGKAFDVYFPTMDERLVEYDVEGVCFDVQSKYQHVQIFQTKSFGKMLVLDDDPNLAESDAIYTDSLMRRGVEKYANSEILILGGGDGALLAQILKEKPKKVTMIEIDPIVMDACKTHLRSLCETVLDQMSGDNYEILISDCLPIMTDMLAAGTLFDFVFGDLTTIPVSDDTNDNVHSLISDILDISFKLVRHGGKFITHAPGPSGQESANLLENLLKSKGQSGHTFQISKNTAFIPSFCENWAFYSVHFS